MAKPTDKKYYLGKISLFFAMKSALDQMIIKRHLAVPKFSRYERAFNSFPQVFPQFIEKHFKN